MTVHKLANHCHQQCHQRCQISMACARHQQQSKAPRLCTVVLPYNGWCRCKALTGPLPGRITGSSRVSTSRSSSPSQLCWPLMDGCADAAAPLHIDENMWGSVSILCSVPMNRPVLLTASQKGFHMHRNPCRAVQQVDTGPHHAMTYSVFI